MKLTIGEKINNPLLKRKEVKFSVEHEGKATPMKSEIANILSAKLNAKKELMFIKKYKGRFGTNKSSGLCLVYANEDAMNRAEPRKMLNEKKRVGVSSKAVETTEADKSTKTASEVKKEEKSEGSE